MSADLLEAFGADEQQIWADIGLPASKDSQQTRQPVKNETLPDQHQWNRQHGKEFDSQREQPLWHRDIGGNNILFDASAEDEDDFGEFENVNHTQNTERKNSLAVQEDPQTKAEPVLLDLLSLNDQVAETHAALGSNASIPTFVTSDNGVLGFVKNDRIGNSSEDDVWGDFERWDENQGDSFPRNIEIQSTRRVKEPDIAKAEIPEDEWAPFEDGETIPVSDANTGSQSAPNIVAVKNQFPSQFLNSSSKATTVSREPAAERPLNIPPPALMLGLLPAVINQLAIDLSTHKTPLSDQAAKVLMIFRVSSRIIAGRSLRWKRDTILAQSMKIGQAGKSGGMKLAALSKGEGVKEEREAAEAIDAWSRRVHLFNSVMTKAKIKHPPLKLSLSMPIKLLTGDNTPTALNVCPVCGLKRPERILGVDIDVQDVFGEFWTEAWGHRDCSEFWYGYQAELNQR